MLHSTFPIIAERSCDGCTRCCEGWLSGNAYGYDFYPGKKCHFLTSKSCSIYSVRPENPCKTFQCQWKENTQIPDWLKPDKCNTILLRRKYESYTYWFMVHTGKTVDPRVYEWANEQAGKGKHLMGYEFQQLKIFSQDQGFIDAMTERTS
jgi:uncharacterized cysteine cluster protein YcgN (CxxCxxCC family)